MKQLLLLLFLVFQIHISFGQLRYTETIFEQTDTLKNVEFATSEWLNNMVGMLEEYNIHSGESKTETRSMYMDIYSPKNDTVSKRPAILFGFSGGFLKGSRHNEDMIAFCDSFARRGYVTITYDYRIGMGADVTSVFGIPVAISLTETNGARAVYRAVQDSRAAIRFLKHRADDFGIDTSKIYMMGSSAGGFVALHNLYMDKPEEIPEQALYTPTLGELNKVGVHGYGSRANAIVSMWGALQTPELIEDEQAPALLVHGEKDSVVYFKKGVPLKSLVPDLPTLNFDIPATYGGFCIDTALNNRSVEHSTYFVPDKKHEFYGVSTGKFGSNGPNQYWDTVHWKISDFLFDIFKPEADFAYDSRGVTLNCFDNTPNSTYSGWDFGDETFDTGTEVSHTYAAPGYYRVKLTTFNINMACDTLSQTIKVGNLSGILAPAETQIVIYPNPVKNKITIQTTEPITKLELVDLWGRTKLTQNNTVNGTIDVSFLQAGIYILRIETSSGIQVQKLQKVN
ncbi:T9SS type A sorting domain-containing protein [Prolixibacteraceae bacterium Z1-6]|uniref:T9SS type A sorting domain-containing protein n=1 Tax=Draconibacterium aestuarii TaxID=2998507 RepID=A0A9X3J4Y9_9BACT|nr:T9SS type A sorting domain-containing protein [Prolixibacteraceae bacterium Z1-6]